MLIVAIKRLVVLSLDIEADAFDPAQEYLEASFCHALELFGLDPRLGPNLRPTTWVDDPEHKRPLALALCDTLGDHRHEEVHVLWAQRLHMTAPGGVLSRGFWTHSSFYGSAPPRGLHGFTHFVPVLDELGELELARYEAKRRLAPITEIDSTEAMRLATLHKIAVGA